MSLNRESRSRDYLYGRLLAIAERTEEMALFIANMSRPTTTVDQLMFRFSERPICHVAINLQTTDAKYAATADFPGWISE